MCKSRRSWPHNIFHHWITSTTPLFLHIRVATIAEIGRGKTYDYKFTDRVEGQFVTLALSGSEKYLTLCEVEVYGYRAPTGEMLS